MAKPGSDGPRALGPTSLGWFFGMSQALTPRGHRCPGPVRNQETVPSMATQLASHFLPSSVCGLSGCWEAPASEPPFCPHLRPSQLPPGILASPNPQRLTQLPHPGASPGLTPPGSPGPCREARRPARGSQPKPWPLLPVQPFFPLSRVLWAGDGGGLFGSGWSHEGQP